MQAVVDNLEISAPYQVQHKVKVRYDRERVRYSGLPEEWEGVGGWGGVVDG